MSKTKRFETMEEWPPKRVKAKKKTTQQLRWERKLSKWRELNEDYEGDDEGYPYQYRNSK